MVEEIRSSADQVKRQRFQDCDSMGSGAQMCRNQARVEQGVQAYLQILPILQCHLAFAASPGAGSGEDSRRATQEACEIEPVLRKLRDDVNGAGGRMPPLGMMGSIDEAEFLKSCQ